MSCSYHHRSAGHTIRKGKLTRRLNLIQTRKKRKKKLQII